MPGTDRTRAKKLENTEDRIVILDKNMHEVVIQFKPQSGRASIITVHARNPESGKKEQQIQMVCKPNASNVPKEKFMEMMASVARAITDGKDKKEYYKMRDDGIEALVQEFPAADGGGSSVEPTPKAKAKTQPKAKVKSQEVEDAPLGVEEETPKDEAVEKEDAEGKKRRVKKEGKKKAAAGEKSNKKDAGEKKSKKKDAEGEKSKKKDAEGKKSKKDAEGEKSKKKRKAKKQSSSSSSSDDESSSDSVSSSH